MRPRLRQRRHHPFASPETRVGPALLQVYERGETSADDRFDLDRRRLRLVRGDDRPALLRGDRVVLRPLRVDDVEKMTAIQSEPEVARWWGPPNETELRRQADRRDAAEALAIEADGEVVGFIQYHEENEPDFRHAGIDLFLTERFQGRGLGPDAIRTLARYLIRDRGHHRLTIDPAADNAAAIRAYEKVGFRAVGRMREYWRSPDGTWHDGLLMDLLARELDQ